MRRQPSDPVDVLHSFIHSLHIDIGYGEAMDRHAQDIWGEAVQLGETATAPRPIHKTGLCACGPGEGCSFPYLPIRDDSRTQQAINIMTTTDIICIAIGAGLGVYIGMYVL